MPWDNKSKHLTNSVRRTEKTSVGIGARTKVLSQGLWESWYHCLSFLIKQPAMSASPCVRSFSWIACFVWFVYIFSSNQFYWHTYKIAKIILGVRYQTEWMKGKYFTLKNCFLAEDGFSDWNNFLCSLFNSYTATGKGLPIKRVCSHDRLWLPLPGPGISFHVQQAPPFSKAQANYVRFICMETQGLSKQEKQRKFI